MSKNSETLSVAEMSPGTGGSSDQLVKLPKAQNFRKIKKLKVIPSAAEEKLCAVQNPSPGTGDSPNLNKRKRSSATELDFKVKQQTYKQKPSKVTKKIKKGKK